MLKIASLRTKTAILELIYPNFDRPIHFFMQKPGVAKRCAAHQAPQTRTGSQVFPVAPRFLNKGNEEKRRDYARQVALLDRQVGHIALARINAHACQMEEVLDDPHEAHLPARARF